MLRNAIAIVVVSLSSGYVAQAAIWPHADGMMEHVFVGFDGQALEVTLEHPANLPLPMLSYAEAYTPPANVLDGKGYSSQFGWLASGTWAPPTGHFVWVKVLDQAAGLETYQGGMRSMIPMHTFAPLFGTNGAAPEWKWGGMMVHNWYAAATPGDYSASYQVFLGDAAGVPNPAYAPDTVTLSWKYVPEPASLAALALISALSIRRR